MKVLLYEDELVRREIIKKIKYIEDAIIMTNAYKQHCLSPSIIRLYEGQLKYCEKLLIEARLELSFYE